MKLYEITIQAWKTFYVEAESEEDAFEHEVVQDEASGWGGEFEWEHDSTEAKELDEADAVRVRARYPKQVVKASEEEGAV